MLKPEIKQEVVKIPEELRVIDSFKKLRHLAYILPKYEGLVTKNQLFGVVENAVKLNLGLFQRNVLVAIEYGLFSEQNISQNNADTTSRVSTIIDQMDCQNN